MRSIVGTGPLAALLLIALAPFDPAAAAPGDVLSTDRSNVNVRAQPSTDAAIVARIDSGDAVVEIRTQGEWHQVRLSDGSRQGWIYSPLLQPVTVAPEPPAAVRAPTPEPASPSAPRRTAAVGNTLPGDPENGETVFYKCGSCHTTVPGIHAQGPSLVGVFGRAPAQASGFRYSGAMEAFAREGAVWDEATLDEFIRRPARLVKGTSMPFSGVRDPKDRRDLIAYLQQLAY